MVFRLEGDRYYPCPQEAQSLQLGGKEGPLGQCEAEDPLSFQLLVGVGVGKVGRTSQRSEEMGTGGNLSPTS